MTARRLRVLVLSRSYPNNVLETLGPWVERANVALLEHCDLEVVSPVPWCPPLPTYGPLAPLTSFTRFRAVRRVEHRHGIRVHHPRMAIGLGYSLYRYEAESYYRAVRRTVSRLHAEAPFDLVHGHFVFPDGVVAQRVAADLHVPYVVTDHAPWVPLLDVPGVREPARAAGRGAARLLAVSTYVRDTVVAEIGPAPNLVVVPNGVDPDEFPLAGADEPRDAEQILFVGLIKAIKGVDVLLEAMGIIASRRPAARLVLAGGAFYRRTQVEEDRLRATATDLGLDDRVTFLGRLLPAEVAARMRRSAVLVLPSRDEAFGAVLVEALASGTPVVSTDSGGPREIVTPEVGRLVPREDAPALAEAVLSVMADPHRFDPGALRRYSLERWGWPSVSRRIHQTYLDAVASR